MNPVFVIGHRNPDTDSICSAICYAELKHRLTGEPYIPCRAGHVNTETKFVLERFGVKAPRYIKSFEPCLSDVQYRRIPGIDEEMSLHRAWNYMNENDIQTLAVVDEDRHLKGLLTLSDIARFYMEDKDANALAEAGLADDDHENEIRNQECQAAVPGDQHGKPPNVCHADAGADCSHDKTPLRFESILLCRCSSIFP